MKKALLFRLAVLVAAMMCALGASAVEAYACYTPSNTTLTFYYDNQRSSRTGWTYDLNTGNYSPGWYTDGTNANVSEVKFDPSFADALPTTCHSWFRDMAQLQTIYGLNYLNTSAVTHMVSMFRGCSSLTVLDLSSFNTANVIAMGGMFMRCSNLRTIYAGSGWSTAAVEASAGMFSSCTSLVGGQGTTYDSSHTNATYAHIDGGPSNPGYFTEKGPEAYACYTSSNTTLTFYYDNQRSSRTGTTYDLNTGGNKTGWESDGTNASVTKVVFDPSFAGARPTTTYDWFYDMTNLQSITGLSYLNTSEVTNMAWMFGGCTVLTSLDVSHFNTSKVTLMYYMFGFCENLTSLDLGSFNTSKVINMYSMFYRCSNLRTIYVGNGWNMAAVTSSSDMFLNCSSLVGGQGTTYDANHVDKAYAHIDGGPSNPGYFTEWKEAYACYTPSNTTLTFYYDSQRSSRTGTTYDLNEGRYDTGWDTDGTNASVTKVVFDPSFAGARPTTTCDWFYGMTNLQSITGMEYLNTSEVIYMNWMFYNCNKLTSLDVSHFNTSKVIYMNQMFKKCTGLTSLDLSSFNTSQVIFMTYMFDGCTNLRTIYVGNGWSTAAVTGSTEMFNYCTSLVGGKGTTYDANHIDKAYAHIDGGTSNPGYFTAKNAGLRGDVNGDGSVNISDVTTLIDLLLGGGSISNPAADCNQDSSVNISDVTALIDYLLSNHW
jgi:surface protein